MVNRPVVKSFLRIGFSCLSVPGKSAKGTAFLDGPAGLLWAVNKQSILDFCNIRNRFQGIHAKILHSLQFVFTMGLTL